MLLLLLFTRRCESVASPMEPLAELQIADSRFLGFAFYIKTAQEALERQSQLKAQYADAAHVPVTFVIEII